MHLWAENRNLIVDKKWEQTILTRSASRQCPSVNGDWGRARIKHWDNRTSQHQAASCMTSKLLHLFQLGLVPILAQKHFMDWIFSLSWWCNISTKTYLLGIVLCNSSSLHPLCSNIVEHWMEFLTMKCNPPLHHLVDQENRRSILPEKREGQ